MFALLIALLPQSEACYMISEMSVSSRGEPMQLAELLAEIGEEVAEDPVERFLQLAPPVDQRAPEAPPQKDEPLT